MGEVKVAPCSHEAAKYAVENWHYSRKMPAGKLVLLGAWESGRYNGAIMFGRGATPRLAGSFGLQQTECVELVRVALGRHDAPVSQIVASALAALRRSNPGLRLVVSFADPAEGHHGGIYQAGNWVYTGSMVPAKYYIVHGKLTHQRSAYSLGKNSLEWLRRNIDPHAEVVMRPGKHRYAMPLDKAMRRKVGKLAKSYPRAVEASTATRSGSTGESQVQLLATAPTSTAGGDDGATHRAAS